MGGVGVSWEEIHRSRPWGRWPAEEVVRALAPMRGADLVVLDLGCGGGAQLWYLAREGFRPVGLDVAFAAVTRSRDRLAEEGLAAPLAQGDGRRLPFRASSFDLVLDVQALSCLHDTDVPGAWREVARVLRPGGRFVTIGFTRRTADGIDACWLTERTCTGVRDGPLAGLGTLNFVDDDALVAYARPDLEIEDLQLRSRTVGPDHRLIEERITVARRTGR
jgi:SAM-dependent methyltransferase